MLSTALGFLLAIAILYALYHSDRMQTLRRSVLHLERQVSSLLNTIKCEQDSHVVLLRKIESLELERDELASIIRKADTTVIVRGGSNTGEEAADCTKERYGKRATFGKCSDDPDRQATTPISKRKGVGSGSIKHDALTARNSDDRSRQ